MDNPRYTPKYIALLAVLAPSFYAMEWGLVGATSGLVAYLKYHSITDSTIWLVLWGLNLLFSAFVVFTNDQLRVDFTFMESIRNFTTAAANRSKIAGAIIEIAVFLRLLLWDGASQLLLYFRVRLPSKSLRLLFFVGSSGVQMFIWAKLYSLGYDSVADAIKGWG